MEELRKWRRDLHQIPEIGRYQAIIEGTSSYYVGDTTKKEVYLTFDAGYDNGEMPKILDTLNTKKVRATFFITGDFVNRFPELCLRLAFGNHSYGHRLIPGISAGDLHNEIDKLADKYYRLTGRAMSPYFRPPAGEFDRASLLKVQAMGLKTVFWSIAFRDWLTNEQKGSQHSYDSVIDNLHNGAIILLHTVSQSNSDALGKIIDEIRNQGYVFKTVEEL